MWMQYATEEDRLWSPVHAGPELGRWSRPTGAEVDSAKPLRDVDMSLLWPVVVRLRGGVTVGDLVERIEVLIAQHGADAVAARLGTLWGSTDYGIHVEVNYPPAVEHAAGYGDARLEPESSHVRLARELRDVTGLSATTLGAALGVTREQYQRWLAGGAISDSRHGQLIYLHTIAADVTRRLGAEPARVWWKTPSAAGLMPEQLLQQRQADRIYQLAAAIPDPAPVKDGVLRGLPMQANADYEEDPDSSGDSWSPYGESAR